MEHNLEDKEIRGITVKILIWLIGCTITICSTTIWTYSSLKSDNAIKDIEIRALQVRMDKAEVEIDKLKLSIRNYQ